MHIVAFILHFAMHDTPITVLEYTTEDGHNPFAEWLAKLRDREAAARVRVRFARIRLGNFGDCKPVGKGVSEIRVPYGPGYRVYFGRKGDTVVAFFAEAINERKKTILSWRMCTGWITCGGRDERSGS